MHEWRVSKRAGEHYDSGGTDVRRSVWRSTRCGSTRCARSSPVLGVIIGTGTIIAVGSIIAGLDGAVTGVIRGFGTNTAIIFKFPIGFQTRTPEMLRRKPITYRDGLAIAARCPAVESVSPYLIPNSFGSGPQINIARYKGNELYNANPVWNRSVLRRKRTSGDAGRALFHGR